MRFSFEGGQMNREPMGKYAKRDPTRFFLPRLQDLPKEAFATPEEARDAYRRQRRQVNVLSCALWGF